MSNQALLKNPASHRLSLWLVLILVCCTSCSKDEPVDPAFVNTYLNEVVGVDTADGILLYNGSQDPQLSLDGDAIMFDDTVSQLTLGERYNTFWQEDSYSFFRTEFPILKIQTTETQGIESEYANARFSIIEAGEITLTGNLGIRLRGNTSLTFPKKSYRLELWEDSQGQINRDASILGMREDDDWLLDGMWNEPLYLRDKSAMELWLGFGRVHYQNPDVQLGADREYCELFINGSYQGLYYIGERLDRKQLQLEEKTNPSDGGELYKAQGWGEAVGEFSFPEVDNSIPFWGNYSVKYPTDPGSYDWNKLRGFKDFYKNATPETFLANYTERVDVDNLVDYFILINTIYAFDNTGNNIFIAKKDQDSPYFFVSWDFDATLGIGIYGDRVSVIDNADNHRLTRRLLGVEAYKSKLKARWLSLRSTYLSTPNIKAIYRTNHDKLLRNKVYSRESLVLRLERQVPNDDEIAYLNQILDQRLRFLDEYIDSL